MRKEGDRPFKPPTQQKHVKQHRALCNPKGYIPLDTTSTEPSEFSDPVATHSRSFNKCSRRISDLSGDIQPVMGPDTERVACLKGNQIPTKEIRFQLGWPGYRQVRTCIHNPFYVSIIHLSIHSCVRQSLQIHYEMGDTSLLPGVGGLNN